MRPAQTLAPRPDEKLGLLGALVIWIAGLVLVALAGCEIKHEHEHHYQPFPSLNRPKGPDGKPAPVQPVIVIVPRPRPER